MGGNPRRGKWILAGLAAALLAGFAVLASAADVRRITVADGLPSNWITALAADEDGIWVGTGDAGVARLSPAGRVTSVHGTRQGLPSPKITSLATFRKNLYAGTDDGLGMYDGNSWEALKEVEKVLLRNVMLRTEPSGERLWVGAVNTSGGLLRFDGNVWKRLGGEGRGPLNHVRAFAVQGEAAWLGSMNSGVYRLTETEFRYFTARDGLPSANVMSLEPFDGTVWAGTSLGLAKFENGKWVSIRGPEAFPFSAVYCLASSPKALYIGGAEGLFRYRDGRVEKFLADDGVSPPAGGSVNTLLRVGDALYAGTSSGLLVIKGW